MNKVNNSKARRVSLGTISQATLGGVRGAIEPFGLFTAAIRLG